jgi:hypothetical protein
MRAKRVHVIKGEPWHFFLEMLRTEPLVLSIFTLSLPRECPRYFILWFMSSLQCKSGHNPKTYIELLFEQGSVRWGQRYFFAHKKLKACGKGFDTE